MDDKVQREWLDISTAPMDRFVEIRGYDSNNYDYAPMEHSPYCVAFFSSEYKEWWVAQADGIYCVAENPTHWRKCDA